MEKWILQYQSLTPEAQQEVNNFVEFIASKTKNPRRSSLKSWKRKLLSVSVWSSKDIQVFNDNRKHLKSWKPREW